MAKICVITKKGSKVAGGYSNRIRATKFNPTGNVRKQVNLQKKRVYVPELKKTFTLMLSTYQTLKKAGVI